MDGEARDFGENVHVHPRRVFRVGHDHRDLAGNVIQQHQVGHGNEGRQDGPEARVLLDLRMEY